MLRRPLPLLLLLAACDPPTDAPKDTDVVDSDPQDTDVADTDPDTDVTTTPCPDDGTAIETTTGCVVRGELRDGVERFLGIPYAKAPVADRRYRRPEPISAWNEPLVASDPGPVCPQSNGTLTGDLEAYEGDEDCLRLNVLRPEGAADLPIVFFIHGGGHANGSGSQDLYLDDPLLGGEAVLVTHNYRLGPLGWLAHPDLSDEDPDGVSGNQGLRDSLMALTWVHDNAAALGGDPNRILVVGESAGSLSACALWLSPDAQPMISAVVGQSGACSAVRTRLKGGPAFLETGEELGVRFVDEAGCGDQAIPLQCLRGRSVYDTLRYLPSKQGPIGEGEDYGPVVDGVLIPKGGDEAVTAGEVPDIPITLTVTTDEGDLFIAADSVSDDEGYRAALVPWALIYGGLSAPNLQDLYDAWDPADFGGDYTAAYRTFLGDALFVCPTRAWLNAASDHVDARGLVFGRPLLGADVGAVHGGDLPYVFGRLGALAPQADTDLSTTMRAAWLSHVDGTPTFGTVDPWPTVDDGWVTVGADATYTTVADLAVADRCAVIE